MELINFLRSSFKYCMFRLIFNRPSFIYVKRTFTFTLDKEKPEQHPCKKSCGFWVTLDYQCAGNIFSKSQSVGEGRFYLKYFVKSLKVL